MLVEPKLISRSYAAGAMLYIGLVALAMSMWQWDPEGREGSVPVFHVTVLLMAFVFLLRTFVNQPPKGILIALNFLPC